MNEQDVVLVLGSVPGEKSKPIEVYLNKQGADEHIMKGLLGAYANHLQVLEPGGTISLIMTRGDEPTEEHPFPTSSGSFVISNPKGDRHVWDFNTMFCKAEPR